MIWFVGVGVLLLLAIALDLSLLVYALYALLAVLLVSRYLTRRWSADRQRDVVYVVRRVF